MTSSICAGRRRGAAFRSAATFVILSSLVIFASCSDSRIFDNDFDLPGATWHVDSIQTFAIEVTDTSLRYNLYHKVRNASDYEFYNLYVKYTITDSVHQKLDSELQEMILFDPKTGAPYGSGLGDIFSHEFPAKQNYRFAYPGKYYFKVQQYMRQTKLNGIHSVGLRVNVAKTSVSNSAN